MKTKYPFCWIAIALVCLPAFAEPPAASQPAGLELGSPYVDLFHGFGLTPPAGAERSTDRIAAQLVSWRFRDAKTNAILWTLAVGKIVNKEAPDDLDAYAKSLAAALKEKENFQLAASQVHEIAGHPAVDFKGHTEGGKVQWWQRQVQIQSSKGEFVLLRMTGPVDAAESMDATMTAVLATVKIINPKEALAQREKNLKAGAEFLKTVTPEKLKAAVQAEPRYGLSRCKGELNSGEVTIQTTAQDQARSIEVRRDVFYVPPGKEIVHAIVKMSASADRASGSCRQQVQSQDRDRFKFTQSDWKIQGEKTPATEPVMTDTATKTIPPKIRGCYLPIAFLNILPQLLDLKKSATYGFAIYTPRLSAFDVYTVTVVGAAKIKIDDKDVQACQIDIQPAEDAPQIQEFLDEKGRVLRVVADGGIVADAVDKETFLKAYPKAVDLIGKD